MVCCVHVASVLYQHLYTLDMPCETHRNCSVWLGNQQKLGPHKIPLEIKEQSNNFSPCSHACHSAVLRPTSVFSAMDLRSSNSRTTVVWPMKNERTHKIEQSCRICRN